MGMRETVEKGRAGVKATVTVKGGHVSPPQVAAPPPPIISTSEQKLKILAVAIWSWCDPLRPPQHEILHPLADSHADKAFFVSFLQFNSHFY